MTDRASSEVLVREALEMLDREEISEDVRTRAAAFLARQALEISLQSIWEKRLAGGSLATMRAQLICLPSFLRDRELSRKVTVAYWALSRICHYHVYELAPLDSEMRYWIEIVALFSKSQRAGIRG